MRQVIIGIALVVPLLVAGCGTPPASEPAAKQAAAPAAATSTGFNAIDACALLPKERVAAVLGEDVVKTDLTMVTPGTAQTAGFSQCSYDLASGGQISFFARQSPVADNTTEAMNQTRSALTENTGTATEAVAGLGKFAFWADGVRQLHVFAGEDRYIFFTASRPPFNAKARAHFEQLAREVIG